MLTDLVKNAAEKAKDAAEKFFELQNIEMAIKCLKAAKEFNPELPHVDDYLAAYKVHELAAKKRTYYELLGISDPQVDSSIIKKQYKRMALLLHPDKNSSVAADGAFKLIQSAFDVLANPEKRKAYDCLFRSKKRAPPTSQESTSSFKPTPTNKTGSGQSRPPHPPQGTAPDHSSSKDRTSTSGFGSTYHPQTCDACRQSPNFCIRHIRRSDGSRIAIISRNGRVVQERPAGFDYYCPCRRFHVYVA